MNSLRIALIGAGNVATHLGAALLDAGHRVVQVYSRTECSASALAARLECGWTTDVERITAEAELYLFCVRDAVLEELARRVYDHLSKNPSPHANLLVEADENPSPHANLHQYADENPSPHAYRPLGADALFVHTAGCMPLDVLPAARRGVLYPMQTFSRERAVRFSEIPIFVESPSDADLLMTLASQLSRHACVMDGERRRVLHVAAVFACNFVNHMYDLSDRILCEAGIPFEVMLPLIDETARKVHELPPHRAQTGPAVRFDLNVMRQHMALLADGRDREIYELLSRSIHDRLQPYKD